MINYSQPYIGVVVRNSDTVRTATGQPEAPKGTVMVKIEGIAYTNKTSESYRFPVGANIGGGISQENLELIESIEVPAYIAAPITGGDGPGNYNAQKNIAFIGEGSDPSVWESGDSVPIAAMFQQPISDGFVGIPDIRGTAHVNTYGASYSSQFKPNQAKGMHAIPNVGSHVIVQFLMGSRNLPVITHILHGAVSTAAIRATNSGAYPGVPGIANTIGYNTQTTSTED